MPLISTLVSICFGIPRLTDTIKNKLYETSDCWSRDMFNFDFKKGSGSSFSTTFSVWFSRKIFFILHSINYTNFFVWLPLLHWDISKNVCCNFSLSILWRHKFWNLPQLSYQTVFFHDRKFRAKTERSQEGKELFRWNKNLFSSFLKDVQTWECTFKMTESVVAATT